MFKTRELKGSLQYLRRFLVRYARKTEGGPSYSPLPQSAQVKTVDQRCIISRRYLPYRQTSEERMHLDIQRHDTLASSQAAPQAVSCD